MNIIQNMCKAIWLHRLRLAQLLTVLFFVLELFALLSIEQAANEPARNHIWHYRIAGSPITFGSFAWAFVGWASVKNLDAIYCVISASVSFIGDFGKPDSGAPVSLNR